MCFRHILCVIVIYSTIFVVRPTDEQTMHGHKIVSQNEELIVNLSTIWCCTSLINNPPTNNVDSEVTTIKSLSTLERTFCWKFERLKLIKHAQLEHGRSLYRSKIFTEGNCGTG